MSDLETAEQYIALLLAEVALLKENLEDSVTHREMLLQAITRLRAEQK
jgi:hypothetical protein